MNLDRLSAQLAIDEGKRPKIYQDTVGKWTGGVGRNLSDCPFSDDEIQLMLTNDILTATSSARRLVKCFDQLDDVRQEVLVNMAFNLGYSRLAGFRNFLAYVNSGEFIKASSEMMNSKWAVQVGSRATRLSMAMKTGAFQ